MPPFRYLRSLEAYSRKHPLEAARVIGAKGARLAWLMSHGIPVPRGWVLDIEPFRELVVERLPPAHDPRSLLRTRSQSTFFQRAARARAFILRVPLPATLVKDLDTLWKVVGKDAPWGLAVRSSATSEDDDVSGIADLATTELGVRGAGALADALRRIWASTMFPRALSHLAAKGVRDIGMAVVFQIVVPADAAGIAWSIPPAGSAPNEMMVNAAFGLGLPAVDGVATPDFARIDRVSGRVLEYVVGEKRRALVIADDGPREIAIDADRSRAPALAPWAFRRLAALARKLERLDPKTPLCLEFVVEGQRIWLVQARSDPDPGFPDGGDAGTVWSRASLGEALPAAATPLTWSIARFFSEEGFRKAFASLGCTVPRRTRLMADVRGRFYLNLTQFMRIAAQVPGLDPKTLVELGGGSEVELLERQVAGVSKRGFYARLPLTATRLLAEQIRLKSEIDRFDKRAARAQKSIGHIDFTILPDDALATALGEARKLLETCGELMLSSGSALLASHVALKTVLARSLPAGAERVAQALTAGVGDLDSAQPGFALARIAAIAHEDPPARRALESGSVSRPDDLPEGPARRALAQFLGTYGERAIREVELATPRWREDPSAVIAMLRAALGGSGADLATRVKSGRDNAGRELSALSKRLSAVEMSLVSVLVARNQRFARLRERMRTWVARALGTLRGICLEIDRRLVRFDPEVGSGCVFFCTFDELVTALTANRSEVLELARTRRAEFARDLSRPDPPVSFVGRPSMLVLPYADDAAIRGVPAGGGVVEGIARVIGSRGDDTAEVVAGEILVAPAPDVGLSPLFLVAGAVVTDLGGPLSHAAWVAREYGIPAVFNAKGATVLIKTGDRVRVDGDRGVVERIDRRALASKTDLP